MFGISDRSPEDYPEIKNRAFLFDMDDLTPTELAEMAHAFAARETHRTGFSVSPVGHALVTVGYPKESSIAQHDTHLGFQQKYDMVLISTEQIENPEGYHDYHLARYMHRDDYDAAVIMGVIDEYR